MSIRQQVSVKLFPSDWQEYPSFCASSRGQRLHPTSHPTSDGGVLDCMSECSNRRTCSAIEWYGSRDDQSGPNNRVRSKCNLILSTTPATQGSSGPRLQHATCYIKPVKGTRSYCKGQLHFFGPLGKWEASVS